MESEFQKHLAILGANYQFQGEVLDRTPQQVWDECQRPDWLLWWLLMDQFQQRPEVVKVICTLWRERWQQHVSESDFVSLRAIEFAERCTDHAALYSKATSAANIAALISNVAWSSSAIDAANCAASAAQESSQARFSFDSSDARREEEQIWCEAIRANFKCPWTPTGEKESKP